ncbi:hypothetical protein IQ250_02335 [Pseudanabaenaceae cyanobacterium LEGE 13415]|nr:hypothetical protein [Pseudanabaenaceae cyanobacterium LEGE 13415]
MKTAIDLSEQFCKLIRDRHVEQFEAWLEQATRSQLLPFEKFAQGLQQDYEAVKAAMSLKELDLALTAMAQVPSLPENQKFLRQQFLSIALVYIEQDHRSNSASRASSQTILTILHNLSIQDTIPIQDVHNLSQSMKHQHSQTRFIALFAGILSAIVISGNSVSATAALVQTREQAIDWQTDFFLHKVNPELNGRKLRSTDVRYIREWNAIRRAVAQQMRPTATNCVGDLYWELFDYDGINGLLSGRRPARSFDRIADAIFYSRHPEFVGRSLSSANSALAREWSQIRQAIRVEQPCS